MNKVKLKIIFPFVFLSILFVSCRSSLPKVERDEPYQETIKEREDFERSSYPNCMYYNTCPNYHGNSGNSGNTAN